MVNGWTKELGARASKYDVNAAKKLLAETDRRIELEIARRKALGLPEPTLPG